VALDDYEIHAIPYRHAMAMVVEHHYLHRRAPASFCYGLFESSGQMVGTIVYGKPASPSLCNGIAGPEESSRVIELTRLWIADMTPKNAESFLIGNSLKMLPDEFDIVVSFAEIGAGHVGTVYQATNWIYTGKSDRHVEWKLDGKGNKHSRHLFDEHGGVNGAKEFYGDRLQKVDRPQKHRYVMFRGSKARKRELLGKLRYEVRPYPKNEGVVSDEVSLPIY
jgi:hypothetical protein